MHRARTFLAFLSIPIAALLASPGSCRAQQKTLENSDFRITYSSSGVTGLEGVQDTYATDYIAQGRTLGNLVVRYHAHGEKTWKELNAAAIDAGATDPAKSTLSYAIGVSAPTIAGGSKPSASVQSWALGTLNDQIVPDNSRQSGVPHFTWYGKKGTREWVEYDFPAPENVSSSEIFWAAQDNDNPVKLPKSWRVLYRQGEEWKEVKAAGEYPVRADDFSSIHFDAVTTTALRVEAQLADDASAGIFEWRVNGQQPKVNAADDLDARESFRLEKGALVWTITLRNETAAEMVVGDLGLPLKMNMDYVWDKNETYTKRVIPHSFIAKDGSFIFWMRANAEGPYLVMTPAAGAGFEYFDASRFDRGYVPYIHSAAAAEDLQAHGGTWRLPHTSLSLAPNGKAGDSRTYSLRFHWAADYAGVRDVLVQQGLFDIQVVPGMTVPVDLPAEISLRTHNRIEKIVAEHPEQTQIEPLIGREKDTHLYKVKFARLGENLLRAETGNGRYVSLEFFVTEPLETLFQKRASFMVTHEQWRDPNLWFNGLISQWDMKNQKLRSPDDLDGLQSYAVACDDPALGKAPYIAAKNIYYPSQPEIQAVEYYIQKFVWGGLQETDQEEYPYAIYGIPNWKVNRDSPENNDKGKKHVWRIYDYPHVILMYYSMYKVAELYPSMIKYLDADGYLERAFGTSKAFFTVPEELIKWSPYETGLYDELVIPDLIAALDAHGHQDQAKWLREHWERKVAFFINQHPDLYASEYPFDSTAFESTHAFAQYAMEHLRAPAEKGISPVPDAHPSVQTDPADRSDDDLSHTVKYADVRAFLEEQTKLNIACRGWLETAYYDLGSDYRGFGNASYTLSYMAQMGGWSLVDYALYYASDAPTYMRLGFASYLSSWALMNTGTAESNYGYWYPGKENDGGAGGGFEPRPWGRAWLGNKEMGRGSWWYDGEIDLGFLGGMRTAATVVVDDPLFGKIAYGGELTRKNNMSEVVPHDGLRARLHIVKGDARAHILLERDGFSKDQPIRFDDRLTHIAFTLENRAHAAHHTGVDVAGLPAGHSEVRSGTQRVANLEGGSANTRVTIPMQGATASVSIVRVGTN